MTSMPAKVAYHVTEPYRYDGDLLGERFVLEVKEGAFAPKNEREELVAEYGVEHGLVTKSKEK